jgi:hypothetical protein
MASKTLHESLISESVSKTIKLQKADRVKEKNIARFKLIFHKKKVSSHVVSRNLQINYLSKLNLHLITPRQTKQAAHIVDDTSNSKLLSLYKPNYQLSVQYAHCLQ